MGVTAARRSGDQNNILVISIVSTHFAAEPLLLQVGLLRPGGRPLRVSQLCGLQDRVRQGKKNNKMNNNNINVIYFLLGAGLGRPVEEGQAVRPRVPAPGQLWPHAV